MAQTDRAALLALYHATGGPAWTRNYNWDTDSPISQWYGVTVIGDRVVKLNLMCNNVQGSVGPNSLAVCFTDFVDRKFPFLSMAN
ncbi:conserved unknown protein [Ectocarpus siliculosus]|uniref:Uncharacterized protein n=1 Tax=Ectocarpus siliculosus TaxID=2880 RepID=D7FVG2_ECTSI|nr:conserved unknown protein [Ectocarpus siliculosus]|eukprot:CBJ31883.1 conserved unknown protein [Ectocarpus siliculosus]